MGHPPGDTMKIGLLAGEDLDPSEINGDFVLGVNGKRSSGVVSSTVLKD